MKSIRLTHVLYGLVGVGVLIWAWSLLDDDSRRIRRQLDRIEALLAKSGPESNLEAAAKARRLGELFADGLEVRVVPYGLSIADRNELARSATGYRIRASTISVSIREDDLEIDARLRTAVMTATAVVSSATDGGLSREGYRLRIEWLEQKGDWLVQRLKVTEILENVPLL